MTLHSTTITSSPHPRFVVFATECLSCCQLSHCPLEQIGSDDARNRDQSHPPRFISKYLFTSRLGRWLGYASTSCTPVRRNRASVRERARRYSPRRHT